MKKYGTLLVLVLTAAVPAVRAFRAPQTAGTPAPGLLNGTITRFGTNEPLAKAAVELRGPQNADTTTEIDGKFLFPELKPGNYRLRIRRDGYWPAEFGQRWRPHRTLASWYLWRAVDLARADKLPKTPHRRPRIALEQRAARPKRKPPGSRQREGFQVLLPCAEVYQKHNTDRIPKDAVKQ